MRIVTTNRNSYRIYRIVLLLFIVNSGYISFYFVNKLYYLVKGLKIRILSLVTIELKYKLEGTRVAAVDGHASTCFDL